MNRRLIAALACRVQGNRLYGKPLQLLDVGNGVTILDHMISLIQTLPAIDTIVLGISEGMVNRPFEEMAKRRGIGFIIGDEQDVLQRLVDCAHYAQGTDVFRVTTESPFFCYEMVEEAWKRHVEAGNDVTTIDGLPEGAHFEIYTLEALERSHRLGDARHRSEYCSLYIREHLSDFKIEVLPIPSELERLDLRLTVDYPEDLVVCRQIYAALKPQAPRLRLRDIIQYFDSHAELKELIASYIVPQRLWPLPSSGLRAQGSGLSAVAQSTQPRAQSAFSLIHSQELKAKAERLIPSCSQTFSKGPSQFVQGAAPVFLIRGQGSHVWDVDGNEYIDYPMALGPIILGHNDPAVTEAVSRQLREGTVFSLPHPLEVTLAERLTEMIPCAEMVRFGKNGSDVTSGAVRLARAYTGRDLIACCGYHGWQDWYIGTTTRNRGVPKAVCALTHPFEYNDLGSLERIFREHPAQIAAVIMEPVGLIPPREDFLERVRALTLREGALLIFDEIITGFRLALGGAQAYFNVTPDLACFGKAMANGLPLSAVVGRRGVMKLFDDVFFSFTFGGETLSLAAAMATIQQLKQLQVIPHLWAQGKALQDGYNLLAREFGLQRVTECIGLSPRTVIAFKDETGSESLILKSLFQQECLRRGVLFSGSQNICASHSREDIEHTLHAYREALEILFDALSTNTILQRLDGEVVQPVFRKP